MMELIQQTMREMRLIESVMSGTLNFAIYDQCKIQLTVTNHLTLFYINYLFVYLFVTLNNACIFTISVS